MFKNKLRFLAGACLVAAQAAADMTPYAGTPILPAPGLIPFMGVGVLTSTGSTLNNSDLKHQGLAQTNPHYLHTLPATFSNQLKATRTGQAHDDGVNAGRPGTQLPFSTAGIRWGAANPGTPGPPYSPPGKGYVQSWEPMTQCISPACTK